MSPISSPLPNPPPPHHVLSIQSHVVSGYVGNKAAVFPLQLLSFDVDPLPSVTLSNHTAYRHGAPGIRHTSHEVSLWLNGLSQNALLRPITHLLTGYIGTSGALSAVADAFQLLKQHSGHAENLVFVCDPVMGDEGKLYVDQDVVQVYIHRILPLATVLTPNAFELGLLTGLDIPTEAAAFQAADTLHTKYSIPLIAVTGTRFDAQSDKIAVLVSAMRPSEGDTLRFALEADFFPGSFTGSGDMMAALLLAWTSRMPEDLVGACTRAMASVTAVLKRTMEEGSGSDMCKKPEIRLVQSQEEILRPPADLVHVRMVSGG